MAGSAATVRVQVCFAMPGRQLLIDLAAAEGTTVEEAIRLSGITHRVPDIDLSTCKVGVYGKLKTMETLIRDNDRIEIYRPLQADPKDARRKRARKKA